MTEMEQIKRIESLSNKVQLLRQVTKLNYFDNTLKNEINNLYKECCRIENTFNNKYCEMHFNLMYSFAISEYSLLQLYQNGIILKNHQYEQTYLFNNKKNYNKILNIITLLEKSLHLSNSVDLLLTSFYEEHVYSINISQKNVILYRLGNLYALFKDVEIGIEYYVKAFNLGNLSAASNLVYIYTQEDFLDLDKAEFYYKLVQTSESSRWKNCEIERNCKYWAFRYLFYSYYTMGEYDKSLFMLNEFKSSQIFSTLPKENIELIENSAIENAKKIEESKPINVATTLLEKYFSTNIINLMADDIKIFIETSINVYEYILQYSKQNNCLMDFSSVTIPAMKAVESLLYKIFAVEFFNFLKTQNEPLSWHCIDKCFIHCDTLTKKKTLKNHVEQITIGQALRLAMNIPYNPEASIYPNTYFVEFCKHMGIDNPEKTITEFYDWLKPINSYRNLSAHKNRVLLSDAQESMKKLIMDSLNFINFVYSKFGKLLNI